jgi:hypothetical protein
MAESGPDGVSIAGLVVAVISILIAFGAVYVSHLQLRLSTQPLLSLEYRTVEGEWLVLTPAGTNSKQDDIVSMKGKLSVWWVCNIGNGPANNILVRQTMDSSNANSTPRVLDPILLPPLPPGSAFSLFWVNPFDTEVLTCQYEETFSGRHWQSTVHNDLLKVCSIAKSSRWAAAFDDGAVPVHQRYYKQKRFVPTEKQFQKMQQDWSSTVEVASEQPVQRSHTP